MVCAVFEITVSRVRVRFGLMLGLLAALLPGCSGVTVHRVSPGDVPDAWHASALDNVTLSPRTLQTLRQWDLERFFNRSPLEAYDSLQNLALRDPQPDCIFALAEMSFFLGRRAEMLEKPEAIRFYYLCAGYSYHYLFDRDPLTERVDSALSPPVFPLLPATDTNASFPACFDPRFRLACDLYNAGLGKCIRAAQRVGRLDPCRELHLPGLGGQALGLAVVHHGFAWRTEEFGPFLFCEDYEVVGMANHYHAYGLGVPLIGTLSATAPAPPHAFYPRNVNFPVTAFLRFQGSVADLGAQRCGQLELYNPLAAQAVTINDRVIPLETDLTTPLAYFLSRTDLKEVPFEGFLRADRVEKRTGIYMFEPYQPGKIPVVMVHGLLSSPLTWAPLFNDLRADPVLREQFQFWFYLYPTANPYLATAGELRQTLDALRAELDPGHKDDALDHMVVAGHSMGGLIARLLTVDSGDDFWRVVSSQSFDHLTLQPQTRSELERVFFFKREPYVRQVIFLATPHHGSRLLASQPAKLAQKFVHLPKALMEAAHDVAEHNPHAVSTLRAGQPPTSLDVLTPGAPGLELLAARSRPPEVHYHSIVGVLPDNGGWLREFLAGTNGPGGTDGLVPYASAHLGGVDSEVIVPAEHTEVHQHPLAVQEVRRILLEHLRTVREESTLVR